MRMLEKGSGDLRDSRRLGRGKKQKGLCEKNGCQLSVDVEQHKNADNADHH